MKGKKHGSKMKTSPIQIYGNWAVGYALDKHIKKFIGYDEQGHVVVERTEFGELVFLSKYRNQTDKNIIIVEVCEKFIRENFLDIDIILTPPSSNKIMSLVAKSLGEKLNKKVEIDFFYKTEEVKSKNIPIADRESKLREIIKSERSLEQGKNILVLDDLIGSSSTLKTVVEKLKNEHRTNKIYVLGLTKTGG